MFSKKKDKLRPRFSPDAGGLRGALSWRVVVEDHGRNGPNGGGSNRRGAPTTAAMMTLHHQYQKLPPPAELEAFLAVSPDSVVVLQDNVHHDVLFIAATKSVIGWTAATNSIRIYFHQGEALILHSKVRTIKVILRPIY